MLGRFAVRPSDDGSGEIRRLGRRGQRVACTDIDGETEAYRTASELDVQYDAHRPHPADAVRRGRPAQPVQRARWSNGECKLERALVHAHEPPPYLAGAVTRSNSASKPSTNDPTTNQSAQLGSPSPGPPVARMEGRQSWARPVRRWRAQ
jgi:hypothetical protein